MNFGVQLMETYLPIINTQGGVDTTYLYFSKKLRDLKYSFAPNLDSASDSKLFRIRLVQNPYKEGEIEVKRKNIEFKLSRIEVDLTTAKALHELLERHKKVTHQVD